MAIGLRSYLPVVSQETTSDKMRPTRYYYSVWLRHLAMAHQHGFALPETVAELGPGGSLGVGLSALLSGANRYYALDVLQYTNPDQQRRMFDELVELFQARTPIPAGDEFPGIKPRLDSYKFPNHILPPAHLARTLAPERLDAIRQLVAAPDGSAGGVTLVYKTPWTDPDIIPPASVDMLVSQAVMEHVEPLPAAYQHMAVWVKPGGIISHQIDYKSHNLAAAWNGHWGYSPLVWRIIRGNRVYFLNRHTHSQHIALAEQNGFEIVSEQRVPAPADGLSRQQVIARYRRLPDEDFNTSSGHILAVRKPR